LAEFWFPATSPIKEGVRRELLHTKGPVSTLMHSETTYLKVAAHSYL
jgi:hypothetical protein